MKNILIFCLFSIAPLCSCTDKKAKQNTDNQLSTEEINEVKQIEKENQNLDQIYNDIEKSSTELDEMLEELDK